MCVSANGVRGPRGGPCCNCNSKKENCTSKKCKVVPIYMTQCPGNSPMKVRPSCMQKPKAKTFNCKCSCKCNRQSGSCDRQMYHCSFRNDSRADSSDEAEGVEVCSLYKKKDKSPFQRVCSKESTSSSDEEDVDTLDCCNRCEASDTSESGDDCCIPADAKNIYLVVRKPRGKSCANGTKRKKNYKIFNCCL